ncbi:MAG: gamma-glutamyltranspeptidase/glutathione hydrolase [Rhodothermales bacterium]|jgi:gamma-glutamyltranspeptidase/glutathione hydrolase
MSVRCSLILFLLVGLTSCRTALLGDDLAPEAASGFRKVALAESSRFMVASAHPEAADCGHKILKQGGSALDAMVAVQAMLTLVEPQSSGLGGGGFLLYYDAKAKQLIAYDGRETAPAAATPDLFLQEGAPMKFYDALVGGRAVGTPGIMRMLELAHARHGRRPWSTLFRDPIQRAKTGFTVTPRLAKMLKSDAHLFTQPGTRKIFMDGDSPYSAGATLKNPALAQTFQALADQGADAIYTGPIAKEIVATVKAHGNPGTLELSDLATYQPKLREPICVNYRGYRVCALPPPSGGLVVLQILKLLEPFDLGDDPQSTDFIHLLAEAERLAYADRARYMADPDFVRVPATGLLSASYLKTRSALIDSRRATPNAEAGLPPEVAAKQADGTSFDRPSTSHIVVTDAEGNIACMTSSIENAFGSRVMVGGFLLNNQLTDFSFRPTDEGDRLVANSLAPLKRPRSSMSPIMVFDQDGKPVLALGSPGGSRIIGYVAQTLIHVLDFGLDVQAAIDLPHVLNRNGKTEVEDHPDHREAIDRLIRELTARGHTVTRGDHSSGIHAIGLAAAGLTGGADPRREGVALGE